MYKLLTTIQFALLRPLFALFSRLIRHQVAEMFNAARVPRYAYAKASTQRQPHTIDGEWRRLPDEPNRW